MAYAIRIIGSALGNPTPADGKFLKSFDPNTADGRGHVEVTESISEAMHFHTQVDAHLFWTTQSSTVPTRPDGKPNRPLTAYTVEIAPVESNA